MARHKCHPAGNMIPLKLTRLGPSGMSGFPGQDITLQRGRQQLLPHYPCFLLGHSIKDLPTYFLFPHTRVSGAMSFSLLSKHDRLSFHALVPLLEHFPSAGMSFPAGQAGKCLLILKEPDEMCLLRKSSQPPSPEQGCVSEP